MAQAPAPGEREPGLVSYAAFTGLRNTISHERLSATELEVGDNVDLDSSGRLARRAGYTSVLAGTYHSLWADDEGAECYFVSGTTLNRLNANYTATAMATLTSTDRVSYSKVNDRVYYSNGVDTGVMDAGTARTWGLAVPALPGATATVGALPPGIYQFVVTQLRGDGQESGAGLAGAIELTASGNGIIFTLPSAADEASYQAVYLSPPNEAVLYLAATVAVGEATVTCTGVGDGTLPLLTQFLSPPPAGQLVAYYRGRMYVAVGDTLFASSPLGYELFDLREYAQLDGRITMLAPITDKEVGDSSRNSGFFIGTDKSCGVLVGSGPADFQYVPKTRYGAVEGALAFVDGSAFADAATGERDVPVWLTEQGICAGLPNMEVRNLTRTRYTFTASGMGAAVFVPGPNRLITTSKL